MKKDKSLNPFLVILLFYLAEFVISYVFSVLGLSDGSMNNPISLVEYILIGIVVCILLKSKLAGQFDKFKREFKEYILIALKCWALGFLLMILSNFVINVMMMNGIAPNEETNRTILEGSPIVASIYMCLIGPFIEELLFRLNFKGFFKSRRAFILASGVLFGAMHLLGSEITLINMLYIIPYSMLGLAFSTCFYDTDNIFTSTTAHVLHNSLTVLIIMIGM